MKGQDGSFSVPGVQEILNSKKINKNEGFFKKTNKQANPNDKSSTCNFKKHIPSMAVARQPQQHCQHSMLDFCQ